MTRLHVRHCITDRSSACVAYLVSRQGHHLQLLVMAVNRTKKAQTVSLCPAEKSGRMVIQGTHIRREKRDVRKAGTNSSGSSIAHLVVFEVQLLQTSILAAKKIKKISYISKADSAQYPNEKIRVREREREM